MNRTLQSGRYPCPKCGRKGLGYANHAHAFGFKDYKRARCRYCNSRFMVKTPPLDAAQEATTMQWELIEDGDHNEQECVTADSTVIRLHSDRDGVTWHAQNASLLGAWIELDAKNQTDARAEALRMFGGA